ncbi:hypothetical protein FPOAC2_07977 [Fusarium poae]
MPFPSPHSHSPSFLPSIAVGPVAVPSFLQSSLFLHLVLTYSLFSFPFSRFSLSTSTSPPTTSIKGVVVLYSILDSASASENRSLARPVYDLPSFTHPESRYQ